MISKVMVKFLKSGSLGSIALLLTTLLAITTVNSSHSSFYLNLLNIKLPLNLSPVGVYKEMDLKLWINDGLMAIFFLLIGLELKREIISGELSSKEKLILPLFGAFGGILLPALIYIIINFNNSVNLKGWAIPTATDIAFAIGIVNLFGNKVSNSLKIFLVALAVVDDLAAIIIISLFYSDNISILYLFLSLLVTFILFILNRFNIVKLVPYLLFGILLWIFVLKSGIHPTIAGVALAFFIPARSKGKISPLEFMEKKIYFSVNYLILPIFAFANAGIKFADISGNIWSSQLFLSIVLGLFLGKQLGVSLAVYLLTKFRISSFFKVNIMEFYGVAMLTGIGFTMSLFIGNLAFLEDEHLYNEVRAGIISGSILSAVCGFLAIYYSTKRYLDK